MSGGFFESWFIWRDAVLVAVLAAAALSYLGVWVVLRRAVYVPLALSGVSSVGVVVAFLLSAWLGLHDEGRTVWTSVLDPAWLSLLCAMLAALWFARPGGESAEAIVAAYLLSGAAVLILGGFVRQDIADIDSVLFGNAVLVDTVQVFYVGAAAVVVFVLHGLLYRRFLFVSFDPDAAGAAGLAVYRNEVLLFGSFALMISVATRAIGALPAFGLMVLPGLVGLRLGRSLRGAFVVSMTVGVLSAGLGYYASFMLELPTGAAMVAVAGLTYLGALARRATGTAR